MFCCIVDVRLAKKVSIFSKGVQLFWTKFALWYAFHWFLVNSQGRIQAIKKKVGLTQSAYVSCSRSWIELDKFPSTSKPRRGFLAVMKGLTKLYRNSHMVVILK